MSERVKSIGCKVVTYKAKLLAKGYRQSQCVDYDETSSPVAIIKSIGILIAIAAHYENEIWMIDVKTTFLKRKSYKESV